ncbi:flagellar motor switch phosphatase FliY [Clostridiaceae bacterium UIB06]|uniref:Flagellar motor switch phosphatase FliY n=1 Tax=Clostridium thailandense TaxID=2794346 RepID=A0A949THD1_9CLOT|nr:flagellar motor switch phosphatase FliY [Clostridium thailandense]MBV7272265.1 flagellar motor switch phosphatase FliY [Clostridium thailandense]MCH5137811.1 flagellar motor switch phosphatase FliY [Clostridiaceae bacterium UIB06]
MGNGFLSQEEIDALLNGGDTQSSPSEEPVNQEKPATEDVPELSDVEKDLLGEIGNISMGSASTALSTILGQMVNITTPIVSVTRLKNLKEEFEVPNIALEVKYTSGIVGENLLVMRVPDAAVIANLMMGGDGNVAEGSGGLSEIEISAVSEAMNQMIGSAATSMATMFMREVNISPPISKVWSDLTTPLSDNISEEEIVVKVSFSLTIGTLVDSHIMQLLPIATAKKIVAIMMGQEEAEEPVAEPVSQLKTQPVSQSKYAEPEPQVAYTQSFQEKPAEVPKQPPVEVHQATFQPLSQPQSVSKGMPKNIDLILDVPLEISVVLGRTKKNIKEILNLGTGSLIELDKLAEEPVEILVNGKKVAYGEVVVVDENFGVRITSIVSNEDRIKSLGR